MSHNQEPSHDLDQGLPILTSGTETVPQPGSHLTHSEECEDGCLSQAQEDLIVIDQGTKLILKCNHICAH